MIEVRLLAGRVTLTQAVCDGVRERSWCRSFRGRARREGMGALPSIAQEGPPLLQPGPGHQVVCGSWLQVEHSAGCELGQCCFL